MFHVPEEHRIQKGPMGTPYKTGDFGAFAIWKGPLLFNIIASDGSQSKEYGFEEWEHVSVSIEGKKRCPTWEEMCWIKKMFWDEEDCVVQYHPPKSKYVNRHPHVLYLWKPIKHTIPLPPMEFV